MNHQEAIKSLPFPVVFINCKTEPFIDMIISGEKVAETRSRDTLRSLVGKTVYLAETGHGKPVVKCSAQITNSIPCRCKADWKMFRKMTGIRPNSQYEWKPETKVKYLYMLASITPCKSFVPPEGTRHGRVYMDYQNI
jgi:hypothetical protein